MFFSNAKLINIDTFMPREKRVKSVIHRFLNNCIYVRKKRYWAIITTIEITTFIVIKGIAFVVFRLSKYIAFSKDKLILESGSAIFNLINCNISKSIL